MKYLFSHPEKIFPRIRKSRRVFLFLDYDGTLTPIVSRPEDAKIPPEVKTLIKQLKRHPRFKIAIISGRSLRDVIKMTGISGIIYAGNHGLEIKDDKGKIIKRPASTSRPLLERMAINLDSALRPIKGVIVEDKGATLSVHFRMTRPGERQEVRKVFDRILRPYVGSKALRVTSGKMVLEVRPFVLWDKGKAVTALLGKQKALPVYIGDDTTDQDAFRAIKGKGISIFVGKPKKAIKADYYLKDTKEVARFLGQLCLT